MQHRLVSEKERVELGFNTVNGKRVHATGAARAVGRKWVRFNTVNGKRVHATLCPGALVGQALKIGGRGQVFVRWQSFIAFSHN